MRKLITAAIALGLGLGSTNPANALIPLVTETETGYEMNMGSFGIEDLEALETGGSFTAPTQVINILGYDPSRQWYPGDRPEDVIKLGDLQFYGVTNYSIRDLIELEGNLYNPEAIALNDLGILEDKNINELVRTIPNFRGLEVRDIPPLDAILPRQFRHRRLYEILDRTPRGLMRDLQTQDISATMTSVQQQAQQINQLLQTTLDNQITAIDNSLNSYLSETIGLEPIAQILNQSNFSLKQQLLEITLQEQELFNAEIANLVARGVEYDRVALKRELNLLLNQYQDRLDSTIQQQITVAQNQISQQLDLAFGELINTDVLLEEVRNNAVTYLENSLTELTVSAESELSRLREEAQAEIGNVVDETISNFIDDDLGGWVDEIGEIDLSDYDLSGYTAADLPGIATTALGEFRGVKELAVSEVPAIAGLDFDRYPNLPNFGTGFARVDLVLSEAEQYADRAISGSDREGFTDAVCDEGNSLNGGCAHIELVGGLLNTNDGLQWVSGESQETDGGHGMLRWVNGGKEPTGRLPFSKAPFKMVISDIDEQTDTAKLNFAFRYGFKDFFGNEHYTPYFIQIPFMTFGVNDTIFLGVP